MPTYQQGVPVNASGEMVIGFGTGGNVVVDSLSPDFIPIDEQGRVKAYADIGDTSATFAGRFYCTSDVTINTTDTVLPMFEVQEAGNVNVEKISNSVIRILKTSIVVGTVSYNLTTTGSSVSFLTWIEGSSDNATWNAVPNTLRQATISTDATVSVGDVVSGFLPGGSYFRFVAKRIGGNSAVLHTETVAVNTGNVTQRAMFLRVYGV